MTQSLPQRAVTLLIVGFLVFYSAQKYLAAAPTGFNLTYVISVVILERFSRLRALA